MSPTGKQPQIIEELRSSLERFLCEAGIAPGTAVEIAARCARQVRADWAGQQLYIPSLNRAEIADRDRVIAERWNGKNLLELCREYGISASQVRKIVAESRGA